MASEEQIRVILQGVVTELVTPLINTINASRDAHKPRPGGMLETKAFTKMPLFTKGTGAWRRFKRKLEAMAESAYPGFAKAFLRRSENEPVGAKVALSEEGYMVIVRPGNVVVREFIETPKHKAENAGTMNADAKKDHADYVRTFIADLDNVFTHLLEGESETIHISTEPECAYSTYVKLRHTNDPKTDSHTLVDVQRVTSPAKAKDMSSLIECI